ncbi:MAG: hypothetical protein HC860_16495 [Alkalinema sp. RU_4_3]|nr:hypothetical protein [Alkalinema sp. RU_4_3]
MPINTFREVMGSANLSASLLTVDEKEAENVAAVQPSRSEVRSWQKDFAMNVGISIIQRVIPFRLPKIF